MFANILVPTDFSASSDAALGYAREVAAKFGSTLYLLHVVEAPFVSGPLGSEAFVADTPAAQVHLIQEAQARLGHRLTPADRRRFAATGEIVSGTTARSIVEYAGERGIDLIVMGTHGRSGMAHLLMGSVAERVVRSAPCPVLTVRDASRLRQAELFDAVPDLVAVDAK
jgi:nucleotide-binding universal stress UspA family protein